MVKWELETVLNFRNWDTVLLNYLHKIDSGHWYTVVSDSGHWYMVVSGSGH